MTRLLARIPALLLLLLLVLPTQAQDGLITGVVVEVRDDDDDPASGVTVVADGETIGTTGQDGTVSIPSNTFPAGSNVPVFYIPGTETTIALGEEPAGCQQTEGDDEEDCILLPPIIWGNGPFLVAIPTMIAMMSEPSGCGPLGCGGLPGGPMFGLCLHGGYNSDFEDTLFGIKLGAMLGLFDQPIGADIGFDYYNPEFGSLFTLNANVTYNWSLGGMAGVYTGGGIRYFHQSFDLQEVSVRAGAALNEGGVVPTAFVASESSGEFGFGAVVGGTYSFGSLMPYAELDVTRAYGGTQPIVRVGVGYSF